MVHTLFSIVARIPNGQPVDVREDDLDLGGMPTVHFASVVVFDEPAGSTESTFGGQVVLEICADGTIDDCIAALLVGARRVAALVDLFRGCDGFPPLDAECQEPDSDTYRRALTKYLRSRVVTPHLFHIGCPGMRLPQIPAGAALHDALYDSISRIGPAATAPQRPLEIVSRLRRILRVPASSKTHWHLDPATVRTREYAWFSDVVRLGASRLRHWAGWLVPLVPLGVLLVALWKVGGLLAIAAGALVTYLLFRIYWRWLVGGGETGKTQSDQALQALTEQEDVGIHNHMASLALLKPGFLRRIAIRAVLRAFNLAYRTLYTDVTPGRLQGLPTIHFAQWSIVRLPDDATKRRREALMFLSNYDGSWESYLDDFLAFLFRGVVMIWGNTVTFPSPVTARSFKQWARTQMTPVRAWHDKAYPELTVANIHNNNRLRLGLLRPPVTDHAARLWLARLGTIKSGHEQFDDLDGELPVHDMQGLLLRGYGGLPSAAYALLRLDDDGVGGRQWLRGILSSITDGRELDRRDRARETEAVNVAFTHSGLRRLGLPATLLEQFPRPFREGMAPVDGTGRRLQHRSRALGDTGQSAPAAWAWGGGQPGRDPDVLLMMYGRTQEEVRRLARVRLRAFHEASAGTVVAVISSEPVGSPDDIAVEHFGFADGLSQPRIEGTWQVDMPDEGGSGADTLKPGEFILGYANNDGAITPGIAVDADDDPEGLLPPGPEGSEAHDFGKNGTFLVARQLSQDVAAFRAFTAAAAGVQPSQHASRAAEHVAARVVGRWRSGVPLVHPPEPGSAPGFVFSSDPHGFACPVGAHIRRANPRDSLGVDPGAQAGANRHRLLRRGRPYGAALPPDALANGNGSRGMMFVCLNADIERQFEFVQQNWINSSVFGGLYAERDPLIGAIDPPAHLTVQANPVSARMAGLSRFVQVVGGEYFFMPGMRALDYLARLDPDSQRQPSREPAPAPTGDAVEISAVGRALSAFAGLLPRIRLIWAIRFPVLVALALVLLPFATAPASIVSLPLFLTTTTGAILTGFLASLVAWMVMVTLRLVLMYGTRIGLPRARWTGPARWRHVFGFQMLALPAIAGTIHYTASDARGAGAVYQDVAAQLSLASLAGLALGLLSLVGATIVQSLRRGGRPDLFVPPIRFLQPIVGRLQRSRLVQQASRRIGAATSRVVRNVPQDLGAGFVDYRHRRLLPGHAFAAVLAGIVIVVYWAGFFLMNPVRIEAAWIPPIAYVLFVLLAIGWLLSAVAFFLDRYRIPTLLTVALWVVVVGALARPDHIFEVGGPLEPGAPPSDIASASELQRPGRTIIVASEGFGLASSAWTAEVLTRLAEGEHGQRFANSVRLISASSGAALGTMHFAHAYGANGFARRDAEALEAIRTRSRAPGSSDAWWGLVYPDLLRAFVPALVPARADRGWAMEQAWRRTFPDRSGPTLAEWRRDVAAGKRPATVFGVTSVESGEQGLLATYRTRARGPEGPDHLTGFRDVPIVTAARLSASFPYVSPSPRASSGGPTAYHVTDGGFWDNSGLLAALDWIDDAGYAPGSVLLIEIRSSPRPGRQHPEERLWVLEAFGPLRTLVAVRYDGQRVRNAAALERFREMHPLEHVVFELSDERVPLTWNLGRADVRGIETAWTRRDNLSQADRVRAYLAAE